MVLSAPDTGIQASAQTPQSSLLKVELLNMKLAEWASPSFTDTSFVSTLQIFKLYRADVADSRVPAFWVVERSAAAYFAPVQTSRKNHWQIVWYFSEFVIPLEKAHD